MAKCYQKKKQNQHTSTFDGKRAVINHNIARDKKHTHARTHRSHEKNLFFLNSNVFLNWCSSKLWIRVGTNTRAHTLHGYKSFRRCRWAALWLCVDNHYAIYFVTYFAYSDQNHNLSVSTVGHFFRLLFDIKHGFCHVQRRVLLVVVVFFSVENAEIECLDYIRLLVLCWFVRFPRSVSFSLFRFDHLKAF